MSLQTRIGDLITAVGTDIKTLRTMITGSNTTLLTSLNTTTKASVIAAINEVNLKPGPGAASEAAQGVVELATLAEVATGTDTTRAVTPAGVRQERNAIAATMPGAASEAAQGVVELATLAEVATGTDTTRAVTPAGVRQEKAVQATETVAGIQEIATQTETNTGTDDVRAITPLKFHTRLVAYAQQLNANLTTLAGVVSGAFGRTLLTSADVTAARTSLGLAAVATSGSASDITTGTLPSSVMPALAINDVHVVANQAAMLALVAQRGDIAKRTDLNGQSFVLQADAPGTLANWIALNTTSDVISVNGQTGTVVLTKSDVGLANVDNTSDANKPVSTAQATAIGLRLAIASNLGDLANVATARTNLSVYSRAELGDPETDLVAAYNTAKA